jgi:hypothetical protein
MTPLLYLMACLMSPAPLIHLAESRAKDSSKKDMSMRFPPYVAIHNKTKTLYCTKVHRTTREVPQHN